MISAQSLPDPFLAEFRTDVLDPCVRVTVHGAPGDEANFKTRPCRNSREFILLVFLAFGMQLTCSFPLSSSL